jgi:hypothetical protein
MSYGHTILDLDVLATIFNAYLMSKLVALGMKRNVLNVIIVAQRISLPWIYEGALQRVESLTIVD